MDKIELKPYEVLVNVPALNCRVAPDRSAVIKTVIKDKGPYTVLEEVLDKGNNSWGKIKELDGWVMLAYVERKAVPEEAEEPIVKEAKVLEEVKAETKKVKEKRATKITRKEKVHE